MSKSQIPNRRREAVIPTAGRDLVEVTVDCCSERMLKQSYPIKTKILNFIQ